MMSHALYGPQSSFSPFDNRAAFESQRRQSRLNAPFDGRSSLRERDGNFWHPHMPKLWMSSTNIFAQSCNRPAKIEMLRHVGHSPDPSEVHQSLISPCLLATQRRSMLSFRQVQRWAVACSLFINGPRVLEETLFVDSPLDSESSSQFVFYLLLIVVREFVAFAVSAFTGKSGQIAENPL